MVYRNGVIFQAIANVVVYYYILIYGDADGIINVEGTMIRHVETV